MYIQCSDTNTEIITHHTRFYNKNQLIISSTNTNNNTNPQSENTDYIEQLHRLHLQSVNILRMYISKHLYRAILEPLKNAKMVILYFAYNKSYFGKKFSNK